MHILRLMVIMLVFFMGSMMWGMEQEIIEQPGKNEGSLQDVRWVRDEFARDLERYKQSPSQDLSTVKGWLTSCYNAFDVTAIPGFFVGLHVIKFVGALTLMKIIHMMSGVPEMQETFNMELVVATAYPLSETIYTTWANKDKKFKENK